MAAIGTVRLRIEPENMSRSDKGSIIAPIWFEFGDKQFPGIGWSDFVVVILGWWIPLLRSNEGQVRLQFMDGPMSLRVIRNSAGPAEVEGSRSRREGDSVWFTGFVDYGELQDGVLSAARQILQACRKRKWESRDIDELARLLE